MGKDTAEPSKFWAWTHTEISWTGLDTVKLADGKSVPLLETMYVTCPTVWFPDRVLTLKHTKPSFIWQLIEAVWYYWEERPVNKMFCGLLNPSRSLSDSPQHWTFPQIGVSSSVPSAEHNSAFITDDLVDAWNVFRAIWWVWRTKKTIWMKPKQRTWTWQLASTRLLKIIWVSK